MDFPARIAPSAAWTHVIRRGAHRRLRSGRIARKDSVSPRAAAREQYSRDRIEAEQRAMQCRQESLEGTGEVKLRRLVKEALRMRPSRIMG
jgi:hypothetical protein